MKKTVKKTLTFLLVLIFSISLPGRNPVAASSDSGMNDTKKLIEERDKAIADSFEIDLSGYKILNPPDKEYFTKNLLQARKQANIQPGDTVPITYINDDESKAYIIKQDAYGINFMFEFENVEDDWILISSDQVKGKIMEPTNQAEALGHRNEAEVEMEIDISPSEFLAE